jgi:biopolymer transport protein ExbD
MNISCGNTVLKRIVFLFILLGLTSSFSFGMCKKGAFIQLPESQNHRYEFRFDTMLKVHILEDGTIYVDSYVVDGGVSVLRKEIEHALARNRDRMAGVALRADGEVKYEIVVTVLEQLRLAGVKHVFMVTEGKASCGHILVEQEMEKIKKQHLKEKQ